MSYMNFEGIGRERKNCYNSNTDKGLWDFLKFLIIFEYFSQILIFFDFFAIIFRLFPNFLITDYTDYWIIINQNRRGINVFFKRTNRLSLKRRVGFKYYFRKEISLSVIFSGRLV